jgi:hypothetical protein
LAGIRASTRRVAELHIELLGGFRTESGRDLRRFAQGAGPARLPGTRGGRGAFAGRAVGPALGGLRPRARPGKPAAGAHQSRRSLPGACAAALQGDGGTVALEAYTQQERLPWSDLVIRTARALDQASRSSAGGDAAAEIDAALADARQMQFNQMAALLAQGRQP